MSLRGELEAPEAPPPTPEVTEPPPAEPAPAAAPTAGTWDSAGIDWSRPPTPGEEPGFTPPTPTTFSLANGISVHLVENHRLPLVSIHVINRAAGTAGPIKTSGLAALTADLLDEGAGKLTELTLPEELERLGATLSVNATPDGALLAMNSMTETLAPTLEVAASVLMRPHLDAADFDRVKSDWLSELALRPDSPRKVASLVIQRALFSDHPYASPAQGFVASVKPLRLSDVKQFWKTHYGPAQTTIVVAGDIDRAQLETMLQPTFGTWKNPSLRALPRAKAPRATPPSLWFVDRPEAPQSVVVLGRLGMTSKDPRYFPSEVINTAIGGSFAARLNTRLREELGYTYGMFSSYWRGRLAGTWSITSSIRTDVTVDGIREALKIINAAGAEDLPDVELAKAKTLLTRAQPQDFETNAGIGGAFLQVVMGDLPMDWHARWAEGVTAVDAAQARALAASDWNDLTLVVVGDWKVLGDGIRSLGFPVIHADNDGNPAKPAPAGKNRP
jgi:zinc protease